jgi:hypothetical protein
MALNSTVFTYCPEKTQHSVLPFTPGIAMLYANPKEAIHYTRYKNKSTKNR